MSTSVIAEGRTEQKAWQDEGQECKVKVAHCGGKSQDREKGIDRGRRVKRWIWWRPGRNVGARARGTLKGRANIGQVLGHSKGRERAGLVGRHDGGRDRR